LAGCGERGLTASALPRQEVARTQVARRLHRKPLRRKGFWRARYRFVGVSGCTRLHAHWTTTIREYGLELLHDRDDAGGVAHARLLVKANSSRRRIDQLAPSPGFTRKGIHEDF
jgi:hypothetical protein